MRNSLFSRLVPLICALIVALAGIPSAFAADPEGKLSVHILDVGQGDAILIHSPTGKNVLVDAGDVKPADDLVNRLDKLVKGPLDMIIMTHPHADHIGGMEKVLRKKGTKLFLDPGFDQASKLYEGVTRALEELAIPVRLGQAGRKIDIGGGASIEILSPALPYFKDTRSDANANSIVSRLTYGSVSFYLAGDSEDETEKGILKRIVREQGKSIKSTVYKVAHHGSKHASSEEILDEIQPEYAVFCVGANNRFGHPTPEALDRIIKAGAKIYRTDENGEVTFVTDGKKMVVNTDRGGPSTTKPVFEQEDPNAANTFIGSSKGKTFHVGTCRFGKKIAPGNRVKFATAQEAMSAGRKPAKCCLKEDGTPKDQAGVAPSYGGHRHDGQSEPAPRPSYASDPDAEPELPADASPASEGAYVASKNSKKFHKGSCKNGMKIKESNKVIFKTREDAVASGRTPAADCKP